MGAGGDIKENHFIGTLIIIAASQINGVADVAKFARLGFSKLDAAGHFAIMHVETRDNTFCNHGYIEAAVVHLRK